MSLAKCAVRAGSNQFAGIPAKLLEQCYTSKFLGLIQRRVRDLINLVNNKK